MFQKSEYQKQVDAQTAGNMECIKADPYRLGYHLMPPVGLLNDPNGLIQWQGTYHVFFQWNPFETGHGRKAWGHYTSEDLIHWTLAPAALVPGAWYDKDGCYSGSAVAHGGVLHLFYTGNVKHAGGKRSSYQCLAVSGDGIHFEKKGPVLDLPEGYTPHFRDPKVWKMDGQWLMVLGAQSEAGHGEAVLARSENLADWEFLGPIAGSGRNGLENFGYMWECPDLFELGGRDVLLVCPQGLEAEGDKYHNLFQAGYFIGDFDASQYTYDHGGFTELDRGFDFYAPQTFIDDDGRRILIAWMGITDGEEQDQPTIERHWVHGLTLPRVLEVKDGKVVQNPVPELEGLRDGCRDHRVALESGASFCVQITPLSEIQMDFKSVPEEGFEMVLRSDVTIMYRNNRFVIERRRFSGEGTEQRTFPLNRLTDMRIFLDRSSVEVFINGGVETFTCRCFPDPEDAEMKIGATGALEVDMTVWDLREDAIDMYGWNRTG